MINLLPQAGLTAVKKEYWVRVVAVWLLFLGSVCLVGVVLLLPTYIKLSAQIENITISMNSLNESATSFDVSAAQLLAANNQARLLISDRDSVTLDYVSKVEAVAGGGIELESLTLGIGPNGETFTVSGIAENRQELVQFRDGIERVDEFLTATLPISNLIDNQDIPFSMNVEIAPID